MNKTERFVAKAKSIHGERYLYTKVEYSGTHSPVTITCRIHGDFSQLPSVHASKKACGCKLCGYDSARDKNGSSREEFINKSIKIHGNKYLYTKVEYINNYTSVIITCPQHGDFKQLPYHHTCMKYGCIKCSAARKGSASYLVGVNNKAKVYLVEMSTATEEFYKIGITTKPTVKQRFAGHPYKIRELFVVELETQRAINLEARLLDMVKMCRYAPKQPFNGHTECFIKDSAILTIIKESMQHEQNSF